MEANKPISEIEDVLVKYITGSATSDERKIVHAWLRQSPDNARYLDQLSDVYVTAKLTQPNYTYNADLSWNRVRAKYFKKQLDKTQDEITRITSRSRMLNFYKYAAIFVLAFVSGFILMYYLAPTQAESQLVWNEVSAPLGSKTSLTLTDGTQVWLNAGSKIRYPNNFGATDREVYLEGEAYFKVTKSAVHKFVVKTSDVSVTAWGTEFNVKAYPEEKNVQTTLVKGVVTVKNLHDANNDQEVLLKPKQSVTYVKTEPVANQDNAVAKEEMKTDQPEHDKMVVVPNVTTELYTSWKDKEWFFEGEAFDKLIVKLERRFNVKIVCTSEQLNGYKFSGRLKEETLEQVLNIIKLTAPIDYVIKNNVVTLRINKESRNSYDRFLNKP
jgi:ferric-dicitrate binding protein FerR (iron transport regulator)